MLLNMECMPDGANALRLFCGWWDGKTRDALTTGRVL